MRLGGTVEHSCDSQPRHPTPLLQLGEVLMPGLRLDPVVPLVDSLVQPASSGQLGPSEGRHVDHYALGAKDLDHPHRIDVDEGVSSVEEDRADTAGFVKSQKKTGSLYDPKTSSIAARISKSVQ